MDKIRIGIIGCGRIADMAYEGYRNNPEAEIRAVCDRDINLAEKRKSEWGAAKAYEDYRALLDDPEVDAVEILTPHTLHETMTLNSLDAGKHVALQKPMTVSKKSADLLADKAGRSDRVCKLTENYLFYPPIQKAKEIIQSGDIGEPTNIFLKLIAGGSGGWEVPDSAWAWRLEEYSLGRGMQTFDHGHHLWSTAWHLMGPMEMVKAWIGCTDQVVDSPGAILWKHLGREACGLAEYIYSRKLVIPSDYYANDEWIEISGTKGLILLNRCTGKLKPGPALSVYAGDAWKHYDMPSDWKLGFIGSAENFIRAIKGEEAPFPSFSEGREILEINLAIARSALENRTVYLSEFLSPFPRLHSAARERRASAASAKRRREMRKTGGEGKSRVYAKQAKELTLGLAEKALKERIGKTETTAGLELSGFPGPEQVLRFSLSFRKGELAITEGKLPEKQDILFRTSADLWARILLKKKKIETAYIQGKIRFDGPIEKVMELRKILGI